MRDIVLKRMEQELTEYREYLVSGELNANQIVEQSYQFVVKRGFYYVFANQQVNKLSVEEWRWLNGREHILDYLYELWMNNDTDLTEEFAEIIHNELCIDMEVHLNE